MSTFEWTTERCAKLKMLRVDDEWSTLRIARHFGVSKGAVCGKLKRLGLSDPANAVCKPILSKHDREKKKSEDHARRKARAAMRAKKGVERPDLVHPGGPGRAAVGCRFIALDPNKRPAGMGIDDLYCNVEKRKGSSYCDHHHKICYMKKKPEQDDGQSIEKAST